MTVRAAVGIAFDESSVDAGRNAALAAVGDEAETHLLVALTTEAYDQSQVLAGIRSVVGAGVPLIGCCTAGLLTSEQVERRGVGVLALSGDGLERAVVHLETGIERDGKGAAQRLAAALETGAKRATRGNVLLFADCIRGNLSVADLLSTLGSELGPLRRIFGAGAADSGGWRQTHVLADDRAESDAVVAVVLDPGAPIALAIAHGAAPLGASLLVSRSQQNTIFELGGQPAIERYRAAWPDDTIDATNFPAHGLLHPFGIVQLGGQLLVRTPVRLGKDGSITCAGDVPERSSIRFLELDPDALVAAARQAAVDAKAQLGERPIAAALLIDCITRRLVMGSQAIREVDAVREVLGADVPLLGMLAYGEIAASAGATSLHNETMLVCLFGA